MTNQTQPSSKARNLNVNKLLSKVSTLVADFEGDTRKASNLGHDAIKVLFHREKFSQFLLGLDVEIVPITFEIWPSLSCDARCPLCTYSINHARKIADTQPQVILADTEGYLRILDKLAASGVLSIIVTGGGEPTLNPDLPRITKAIQNHGMQWGMFTHGLHLSPELASSLLEQSPRFLRISINSGSAAQHNKEYRLGDMAYVRVMENAIAAGKMATEFGNTIGLGYALDGRVSDDQLIGIGDFIIRTAEASQLGVAFASFRPKTIYYKKDSDISIEQPRKEQLASIQERLFAHVIEPVERVFGKAFRIDNKEFLFQAAASSPVLNKAIATGWTGQMDHNGVAYITSELNGSPWKDAAICRLGGESGFSEEWSSESRRRVFEMYSTGVKRLPLVSKLAHVELLLQAIRDEVGILNEREVDEFWNRVVLPITVRPRNWDFL